MNSICNNHAPKFTWPRLILAVVFVAVNVALYVQSKNLVLETFFPAASANGTVKKSHFVSRYNSLFNGKHDINLKWEVGRSNTSGHDSVNTVLKNSYNHINDTRFGSSALPGSAPDIKPQPSNDKNQVPSVTSVLHLNGSASAINPPAPTKPQPKLPFLSEPIVNKHEFQYLHKPNVSCSGRTIELVICVPVSRTNFLGRQTIRDTWGSYAYNVSNNAILVFFIGAADAGTKEKTSVNSQHMIDEEAKRFGDILQEDFVDSYNNLSLKSVSILKWTSHVCPNAKFVLKADDDMYVNVPVLVKTLRDHKKLETGAFAIGSLQVGARAIRSKSSKWYTPLESYKYDVYPKYLSGTAYAMTSSAASLLYEASLRVPLFWLEDIYITGLCAKKAEVTTKNDSKFTYGKPQASGCSFRQSISGHRYKISEIKKIHLELYDQNLKC